MIEVDGYLYSKNEYATFGELKKNLEEVGIEMTILGKTFVKSANKKDKWQFKYRLRRKGCLYSKEY